MSIKNKILNLFKPVDLTTGKPWKQLLIFMLPILISLVFQQVYIISDAAIVGNNLSSPEVSGVNVVYSLLFFVLQFAFGCTSGFSVVSSNKAGAKDYEGVRKSFAHQLALSLLVSIILTVAAVLLIPNLLSYVGLSTADADYEYAYKYLQIIYLGLFTQLFYNLMVSVLRSIGDSLTPLLFLIASTILNIGLDYLCILGFHWGVEGAAIATVFSQFVAFIACFIYSVIKYPFLRVKLKDFKLSWSLSWEHLRLGLPLAFQFSILAIGLITLEKAMVGFDIGNSANLGYQVYDCKLAYGVAVKFNDFLICPLSALGTAMLSFAGQNLGCKDIKRIKKSIWQAFVVMLCIYAFLLVVGIGLSINGFYTNFFLSEANNNDRVRWYASIYMIIDVSAYLFLGLLFLGRNLLQGLGKSLYPFLAGVGELVARVLVAEFMPRLVDPVNPSSDLAFIATSFSDCVSWFFAIVILGLGTYIVLVRGRLLKETQPQETLKA